jgi:hypothetical protein
MLAFLINFCRFSPKNPIRKPIGMCKMPKFLAKTGQNTQKNFRAKAKTIGRDPGSNSHRFTKKFAEMLVFVILSFC